MDTPSNPHAVELTIRIVGQRPWNRNSRSMVERVLRDKASDAAYTAQRFADQWTKNGEPCTSEVTFREVRVADQRVRA